MLVFLLFVGISFASAQDVYTSSGKSTYKKSKRHKGYDPDRLIVGGRINASFSTGYMVAGLSPVVGYRITKHLSAGVGVGYLFYKQATYQDPVTEKLYYSTAHIVYPNLWARCFVWRNIFVDATYEHHMVYIKDPIDRYGTLTPTKSTITIPRMLVGAGYRQPIGNSRVSVYFALTMDVLNAKPTIYTPGPDIRIGVLAGM